MMQELSALFKDGIEDTLEQDLGTFTVHFSCALHYSIMASLEERIEVLSEATAGIKACMPSASFGGTAWGSVVTTWPRGRRIHDEAVLHLEKAKVTQVALVAFSKQLAAFKAKMDAVKEKFQATSEEDVHGLEALVRSVHSFWSGDGFKDCMTEFVPLASSSTLADVITPWARFVLAGLDDLLAVILKDEADSAALRAWCTESAKVRDLFSSSIKAFETCRSLFDPGPTTRSIALSWSITQCLAKAAEFLEMHAPTLEAAQDLKKDLNALTSLDCGESMRQSINELIKSPLMASTAELQVKLNGKLVKSAADVLSQFVQDISQFFKEGQVVTIHGATKEELSTISAAEFVETSFGAAMQWSRATGDLLLLKQVITRT